MSVLFFLVTLVVFPKADGPELAIETSFNAWTFTPRWSIEPYPGYQVFLANRLRLSHAFLLSSNLSVGIEIGVANRFHVTYYESYGTCGIDDSEAWMMLKTRRSMSFFARLGLPTGHYDVGIGRGAYCIEVYSKVKILGNWSIHIGYEWTGTTPDEVNIGDKMHLGLEMCDWCGIRSYYAFADQGAYYSLHDSPSFAVEISVLRNFTIMEIYNLALVLNQTILGKDTPVSTSISLRMSSK